MVPRDGRHSRGRDVVGRHRHECDVDRRGRDVRLVLQNNAQQCLGVDVVAELAQESVQAPRDFVGLISPEPPREAESRYTIG